jgi:hypothetical protein
LGNNQNAKSGRNIAAGNEEQNGWDNLTPTKIQKKPIIQPEVCTIEDYYNSNQNQIHQISSQNQYPIKFAQRRGGGQQFFQDDYEEEVEEEVIVEKVKLG